MPTFAYTVDDEPQTTDLHEMTPNQILAKASLDPSSYYLIELQGDHQVSFQGRPDVPIHMHEGMRFIAVFTGPVPVSA